MVFDQSGSTNHDPGEATADKLSNLKGVAEASAALHALIKDPRSAKSELNSAFWLTGNAGIDKTKLVKELAERFFKKQL